LIVSDEWKNAYPGASAGILVMHNVTNPEHHPELDGSKTELENRLRAQFSTYSKKELSLLPSIQPYGAYYGRYKKRYHALLQLESVALKGKPITHAVALVEAMFLAELKNQLLTTGHDLQSLWLPVKLDAAAGCESYALLNGRAQVLEAGEMMLANRKAFFAVYAASGIGVSTTDSTKIIDPNPNPCYSVFTCRAKEAT
jgi:DNA/RNA-binding domain of Phe-tRNA-synthetase-like protein